ncbi:MAG: response regulator [Cytophagales bacterium]|jgi:CheY-like chemotaxis protein|nr:response regulator [Cytophagales bacterium]
MSKVHTVLLIDDDEINNLICTKIIKKNDFAEHIETSLGARQALNYLQEAISGNTNKPVPDLIFLDINMPAMNGWDFLDQYEKIEALKDRDVILIMLSSSMYVDDINRAKTYPSVSDYITKPLTAAHLQQITEKFFATKED